MIIYNQKYEVWDRCLYIVKVYMMEFKEIIKSIK